MFAEPDFHWRHPEWRQAAESWIHEKAAAASRQVIGPITGVRFLPWSAVLRAPTDQGDIYFKACGPSQQHEPGLAAFLAVARPDCMIPVLAADPVRGWYLMPDGGQTLTGALRSPKDEIDHWTRVLALQVGVQRELMPSAEQMLGTGVLNRRSVILPELLENILVQPDRLRVGYPGAMTAAEISDLLTGMSRLREICRELSEVGPPDTFVHDDFHEDHIFATQRPDGSWRYVFFDFGDACISHPFVQLVSQPRFAGNRFGLDADPIQNKLREFYLSQWRDFRPPAALERALSLALIAGCVVRALTWVNACGEHHDALPPGLNHAYATGLAFWLRQLGARVDRLDAA